MAHDPNIAKSVMASLAEFALGFPGAWHDTPWGDSVVKVGKKIFVFLGTSDDPGLTVKVPESHDHALSFPRAAPTGYGLGKHGWVTIWVNEVRDEEIEVLYDFIEESYRAVATKTMIKQLDANE
jgi:predicted DNA-binding protein (MmcQ/YjbR family)